MEENKLIKKLKETPLPEIEIPSHKRELKQVLLEKFHREKRSWEIFNILKKAIPLGAIAIILIVLILNNLIFPRYTLAQAKEIALKNPQIKELMEKGAIIKDVKILKNKGYVLIQPPAEIEVEEVKEKEVVGIEMDLETEEEFIGALAEVDLKKKQISKIEDITPQFSPLIEEEKEKAKEIAGNNPKIQEIIPREAEIKKIMPLPFSQLKLVKEKNSVKVIPEQEREKRVRIIYELNREQWEGEIDLIKEKVRRVKFLGETEK